MPTPYQLRHQLMSVILCIKLDQCKRNLRLCEERRSTLTEKGSTGSTRCIISSSYAEQSAETRHCIHRCTRRHMDFNGIKHLEFLESAHQDVHHSATPGIRSRFVRQPNGRYQHSSIKLRGSNVLFFAISSRLLAMRRQRIKRQHQRKERTNDATRLKPGISFDEVRSSERTLRFCA